ncbi:hypothetical protein LIS04_144 [Listeria phage LIS04]|nr:hypothetical protein LIS04_144 [Listeria phage LIS04]
MSLTITEVNAIIVSTPGVVSCDTKTLEPGTVVFNARVKWWAPYLLNTRKMWLHLDYVINTKQVADSSVAIRLYSWRGKLLQS